MFKKLFSWNRDLVLTGLVVLVGLLLFLPFVSRFGFYRDDWYMLWSANVRGADSIIELFSIDRPFMGYTYALTYRLLGNFPLPWQAYAIALKTIGALAVYGIVRLLWPEQRWPAAAAALLFLAYPGFLGQPDAATMTNQLLSLTAELASIWLSGLAVRSAHRGPRILLVVAAVLLEMLNLLLYEYMIGLEVMRLGVLWLVPPQGERLERRRKIRRLLGDYLPYAVAVLLFLVWRLAIFHSERSGTNQFAILQSIVDAPRGLLVHLALQSVMDFLETLVLAWGVPFEQLAALEKPRGLAAALLMGALVAALAVGMMGLAGRDNAEEGEGHGRERASSVCLLGALSLYGALFPVLAAGRDATFSGGFDRYTLHASPAAAILLAGLIFGLVRARPRQTALALLLFLGAATHVLNGYHWQRFWEDEKALWWQLWWRAPGLQDGTVLLASMPEEGFFEDYEMWGPANLIYRPKTPSITIGAEVLNPLTLWKVRNGTVEVRGMRKLAYTRDFNRALLLALPGDHSCLKVVDQQDLILPLHFEPQLAPILRFSHVEQIDLQSTGTVPPPAIFGPEPAHDWCFYYQKAELAKQAGDWSTVVQLAEEAAAADLRPIDRSEWLPFLEAYLWAGDDEKVAEVAHQITAELPLNRDVCDELARGDYRFGEAIQQALQRTLCR